jgi:hypothetical protein
LVVHHPVRPCATVGKPARAGERWPEIIGTARGAIGALLLAWLAATACLTAPAWLAGTACLTAPAWLAGTAWLAAPAWLAGTAWLAAPAAFPAILISHAATRSR